jgi:glycosyltransferase involved in cell wall biosynthesis
MRVLFLTHAFPRHDGDASGEFLARFATALHAQGVQVQVVAPAAPGEDITYKMNGTGVDRFHYAPRKYETLASESNLAERARDSWKARFTLLGFLGAEFRSAVKARRAIQPDVVHAHWWFPSGLVGTWLSRLSHMPLVTTLHGADVRLARSVSVSRAAFRHVLQHSHVTTAVSHWLAFEAQSIVAIPSPIVAPMPVATDLFTPGGARDTKRLLFVGQPGTQKGLDILLRALAQLPQAVSLDVVGDGEGRAAMEQLAGELGVTSRVRWHGALSREALVARYRAASALVVPSADETRGIVAVEAALCETPVIAFESGGLPEIVQHDRTGLLVRSRSADALAQSITHLFERDDQGRALGEAGRLHALATFAPESVARRYIEVYQNAIASSPKPSPT